MTYSLRSMKEADAQAITEIFNYFIRSSMAAFREEEVDESHIGQVLAQDESDYPRLVAETDQGEVVGFCYTRPYHDIPTFDRTRVITYFIRPEHTGAGLGKRMLEKIISKLRPLGVDTLLASVVEQNEQSLNFHLKHGFAECGRFPEVGIKSGQPFDLFWFVRKL